MCQASGQNPYYSMDAWAQVEQAKNIMEVDSASERAEKKGSAIDDSQK